MDYEELSNLTDEEIALACTPTENDSEFEIRQKRLLGEKQRAKRDLDNEIKAICYSISNPEDAKKLLGITVQVANTIFTQEMTIQNVSTAPYQDLVEADKEFFEAKKYKPIHNLHKKVSADIKEGIEKLKEEGTLDMRKQRYKKKANDYLGGLANSKLLADMAKRQKEADERLARLELAQQENNSKFEQIGAALILQNSKIDALTCLGVDTKKIEAYKLHLAKPHLTRQELADELGKSKPTIIKWLQEVQEEITKSAP